MEEGDGVRTTAIGAVLLVVAVALGALTLATSYDGAQAGRRTGAAAVSGDDDTATPSSTTTTPAVLRPAAQVTVLVLNGVDPTQPIAGVTADRLSAAGYTVLAPEDAAVLVTTSSVYFAAGYQADAAAVASALTIAEDAVVALPRPLPPAVTDARGAKVVVVVGPG